MKKIPQVPPESTCKPAKQVDRVAWYNLKLYDMKSNPAGLSESIREMEKIFAIVKLPE